MANTGHSAIDSSTQKTNQWLRDVGEEIGSGDRDDALRALRATLHAVRDRLTTEESAHFASQLPLTIRGIYYEGWRPSETPISSNTLEDFISDIQDELPGSGQTVPPTDAYKAVFRVLDKYVDAGELSDVKAQLSEPIVNSLN